MNNCTKDIKSKLRKKLLKERNSIEIKIRKEIDKKIIKNILESDVYISAKNIFTFVGVKSEINTLALIKKALEDKKNIFVPLCIDKSIMEARKINSILELEEKRFGLLEPPRKSKKIDFSNIDFSIVPCISVDKYGYRLGYGGGYYDKFFYNKDISTAFVICREQFIVDALPYGDLDVKFENIISENGIVKLKIK